MLILGIDTSTRSGSLALVRDETVLGQIANRSDEPYSSRLIRDLEGLLAQTRIQLKDVDLIAVAAGPGSFTGLRVGLTAAKAWAEFLGVPIAAISGLEAIAAQVKAPPWAQESFLVAAVLDARRGQIFGGIFEVRVEHFGAIESITEELVVSPQEFLELVSGQASSRPVILATPTPGIIAPLVGPAGLQRAKVEQVSGVLAPVVGQLGFLYAKHGQVVDALHLDANYLRRSDAELNWRDKH